MFGGESLLEPEASQNQETRYERLDYKTAEKWVGKAVKSAYMIPTAARKGYDWSQEYFDEFPREEADSRVERAKAAVIDTVSGAGAGYGALLSFELQGQAVVRGFGMTPETAPRTVEKIEGFSPEAAVFAYATVLTLTNMASLAYEAHNCWDRITEG